MRNSLWLLFEEPALYFALVDEILKLERLLDVVFAGSGELLIIYHTVSVAIREPEEKVDLERCQVDHFASLESLFGLSDVNCRVVLRIFLLELLKDLVLERIHVVFHHFTNSDLISDMVKHAWKLCVMNKLLLLKSDQ